MLYLFQSSQAVVPVWLAILLAVIAASGTWLTLFINRKRRGIVKAEEVKLEAEARSLEIQSLTDLYRQLRDTRTELAQIVKDGSERAKESRRRENFLRDQVRYHEELTILARQATHAAINEIQRCVMAIRIRDDVITEARVAIQCVEDLLTENKIKFIKSNLKELPVFEPKEHEEIVKYQALPLPPECPLRTLTPPDKEEQG